MNIDEELGAAMRELESDSPAPSAISATVRARIAKRNKIHRTAVAGSIAAAVVLIVTTAPLLIAPSQSDVQTGSSPATPLPSNGAPSGLSIPSTKAPLPSNGAPIDTPRNAVSDPVPTANTVEASGPSARCYATADIGRTDNYLPFSLGSKTGPEPAGPAALEICRQNWTSGTLSGTEPFIHDSPAARSNPTVPGLVACVIPAQMSDENTPEVAVFPGTDSTCAELNLPVYIG